jgi:hypothetical protein
LVLTDVLVLAGEDPEAVREGVRVALADCEAIFRVREDNKRMKDQAAHVCRAQCRTRVVAEMHQLRGTRLADHLKVVLSIMTGRVRRAAPPGNLEAKAFCMAMIATTSQM